MLILHGIIIQYQLYFGVHIVAALPFLGKMTDSRAGWEIPMMGFEPLVLHTQAQPQTTPHRDGACQTAQRRRGEEGFQLPGPLRVPGGEPLAKSAELGFIL